MAHAPLSSTTSMFQNITQMPAMHSWKVSTMKQQSIKKKTYALCHVKQSRVSALVLMLVAVWLRQVIQPLCLSFYISITRITPTLGGATEKTQKECIQKIEYSAWLSIGYFLLLLLLELWRSIDAWRIWSHC